MKNSKESLCFLSTGFFLFLFIAPLGAEERAKPELRAMKKLDPSWLPKVSCKDRWKDQGQNFFRPQPSESYTEFHRRIGRADCYKDWSLLIYMAADNNLNDYALLDIQEMEEGILGQELNVASSLTSDVIAQLDPYGDDGIFRYHLFSKKAHEEAIRSLHRTKSSSPTRAANQKAFENRELYESLSAPIQNSNPQHPYRGLPPPQDFEEPLESFLPFSPFSAGSRGESLAAMNSPFGSRSLKGKTYRVSSPMIDQRAEINTAQREELSRFLSWGVQQYPAKNYMVVLWGHGQGWKSRESGYGGIAFDEHPKDSMNLLDLSAAIKNVVHFDLEDQPIDILASDACLMQSIEVISEIGSATREDREASIRFAVGSTEKQSLYGLPYREILQEINSDLCRGESCLLETDEEIDQAYALAKIIPELNYESFLPHPGAVDDPEGFARLTLSSVSVGELQWNLLPEIHELALALIDYLEEDPFAALDLQAGMNKLVNYESSTRDLGALLTLLDSYSANLLRKGEGDLEKLRKLNQAVVDTRDALARSVVAYSFGSRYKSQADRFYNLGFKALSVWVPGSHEEYKRRIEDYRLSDFFLYKKEDDKPSRWTKLYELLFDF